MNDLGTYPTTLIVIFPKVCAMLLRPWRNSKLSHRGMLLFIALPEFPARRAPPSVEMSARCRKMLTMIDRGAVCRRAARAPLTRGRACFASSIDRARFDRLSASSIDDDGRSAASLTLRTLKTYENPTLQFFLCIFYILIHEQKFQLQFPAKFVEKNIANATIRQHLTRAFERGATRVIDVVTASTDPFVRLLLVRRIVQGLLLSRCRREQIAGVLRQSLMRKECFEEEKRPGITSWIMVGIVWMCSSSALIFVNNYIMNTLGFHFPIAVCSVGASGSWIGANLQTFYYERLQPASSPLLGSFSNKTFSLALLTCLVLITGNSIYLHCQVHFIQMMKSLGPVLTYILSRVVLRSKRSKPKELSVCLLVIGTAVSGIAESQFDVWALCTMLTLEFLEALRVIALQECTQVFPLMRTTEIMRLLYPTIVLFLFFMILVFEAKEIFREGAHIVFFHNIGVFIVAATLGAIVNLTALMTIRHSSALSFKVIGQIKHSFVIAMSAVFIREVVTIFQLFGYMISYFAYFMYLRYSKD